MIVLGQERDYIVHDEKNVKGFFGEYRFLSNFEVSDVYFEGEKYTSSEAAYQAAKSLDPFIRSQFQGISPSQTKKMGRKITVRSDWERMKRDVMSVIVFDKFYRNLSLREKLLSTGEKYLEETNHWNDQIWGVCEGKGENSIGKILMKVRDFWKGSQKVEATKLF